MDKALYQKNQLIAGLFKIGHGDLKLYVEAGLQAAKYDPNLFAHVVAYNAATGEVRDSKVAFPVIALRGLSKGDDELAQNAVAHLLILGPRELYRAYDFSKSLTAQGLVISGGYRPLLQEGIQQYLKVREHKRSVWDNAVLSDRKAMVGLYAVSHTKPSPRAQAILFEHEYPKGSVFEAVKNLKDMGVQEAAGTIINFGIPFPVAVGAGVNVKDELIALALIEQMTGNQVLNNTAMLKKLGVLDNPVLKSAYDKALERAKGDKRVHTLKAQIAANIVGGDAAKKLEKMQEEKLEQSAGVEGDWLVLGDKSGSMTGSIEGAKQIAAVLAKQVRGSVYLVWFDTMPTLQDATGKTLKQIEQDARYVRAGGGTSIGCGLEYIREKGIVVNGIVIVSDGAEHSGPYFVEAYGRYAKQMQIEPMVHMFRVPGEPDSLSGQFERAHVPAEVYASESGIDYYSLPNIVRGLKTGRYKLLDDIMQTPLMTLAQALTLR